MKTFQFQVTERDIERYAEVSQDRNPVHLDEKYAKAAGFSGKIAHGMLTMSKVLSIVSDDLLRSSQFLKSYEFIFLSPVYVDDVIMINIDIKKGQYYIGGTCRGELVLKGIILI